MMLQWAAHSASAGEESLLKGTQLLASGAALIALTRFLFSVLALLYIFEMRVVGALYMALS